MKDIALRAWHAIGDAVRRLVARARGRGCRGARGEEGRAMSAETIIVQAGQTWLWEADDGRSFPFVIRRWDGTHWVSGWASSATRILSELGPPGSTAPRVVRVDDPGDDNVGTYTFVGESEPTP